MTKSKAVSRLADSLDEPALQAYATDLMKAFARGELQMHGVRFALSCCTTLLATLFSALSSERCCQSHPS